jgi:bacterioferritin
MKGDARVIEYLNRGLRSELTATNQYWLHYRLLDNWGFKDLAKKWREESIEEMRHADRFIERIIFLEGFPNLQVLDPLHIGQSVKEVLDADLQAEYSAFGACTLSRSRHSLRKRAGLRHAGFLRGAHGG